jgi:hypothetical protein
MVARDCGWHQTDLGDDDFVTSRELIGRKVSATSLWLDQPLSRRQCQIGWIIATIVFLALTAQIGGPVQGDASVSVFSTWLIAHGHLACAYELPKGNALPSLVRPYTLIAPLYPVLTGIIAAIFRIGHSVPFPTATQLGPHCSTATTALYHWANKSQVIYPTIRIGYFAWLPLMAGVVALLRASGRGRCRWEPLTLLLIAVVPPVAMCITEYFHPQDLLAMGLILIGLARVSKNKWVWAGILLGLALATNQFALLVWAPLVVVAPKEQRNRFLASSILATAAIDLPFIILTSGRAFRAVVIGSGFIISPIGGTVFWETHAHGDTVFIVSRLLPILLALSLTWWAARRLGPRILEPVPLISLIATVLTLRLAFESNLWGYYFMPLAVMLIVLDVTRHRFRRYLIVWIAIFMLAFNPIPWGFMSNGRPWGLSARLEIPMYIMIVALLFVVIDVVRRRYHVELLVWLAIAILIFIKIPWTAYPDRHLLPTYLYQIVLVLGGGALAISPLISAIRNAHERNHHFDLTEGDQTPPSPTPQLPT